MFITFEGIEASGKSTQAKLLFEYLQGNGIEVVLTKEPGGTKLGEQIRSLLLESDGVSDPVTEMLLISAARKNHISEVIKPALISGKHIICDRYIDSSLAYQGYAKGMCLKKIKDMISLSTHNLVPHLTFLLDLPAEVAIERIKYRKGNKSVYDKQSVVFHNKVREGFLELARNNTKRFRVISGMDSKENIFCAILKAL